MQGGQGVQESNPQPTTLNPQLFPSLWQETLNHFSSANPEAYKLIVGHETRYDNENHFNIVADTTLFDEELRPFKVEILEWMRKRTGCRELNFHVIVEQVEREKIIYAPRDKYEAMLAANPTLETFHILFPEIDY